MRRNTITSAAATMPTDWIIREKSRATWGSMPKPRVMMGNATAPPPSLVVPAMNDPSAMVADMSQYSMNNGQRSPCHMSIAQLVHTSTMISRCGTQEACLAASGGACVVLVFLMRGIIRFWRLIRVSPATVVSLLMGVPTVIWPAGGEVVLGEPECDMLATMACSARNCLVVRIYYTSQIAQMSHNPLKG